MNPHARQQLLIAVIVICLILIAYWWYQSPYGPGGRYAYGLTRVSWTNGAAADKGTLVLALDRSPTAEVCAGKISSFTSGLTVSPSDTLSSSDAQIVMDLLPRIANVPITAADSGANTITYQNITPPTGWPFASTSGKNQTWSASTADSKGNPSAKINVVPSAKGCGS